MSNLLSQASLVMIPSGYKEDTVYSPVPTNGNGDLSFTRASNGTRVNSAGLVEVCPWNLVQQSEDFTNAAWTTANLSVTSNSTTAPNGTTTADTITEDTSTTRKILYTTPTIVANQEITLTIYVKANTLHYIRLIANDLSENFRWFGAQFNLTALTYTSATGSNGNATFTSASITDAGNGWYRISVSGTINTTSLLFGIFPSNGTALSSSDDRGGNTYLGTSKTAYIWGAQLNIGATAKPYFPTTDRLNVPRLTYQNGGGGCPSLLLEKQSTNLLTYSEQFDNAAWSKSNVTITANNTTSPDGTQNADLATATSGGELLQGLVLNTSTSYTFSFYVKKGTATDAKYRVYNFDAGVNVVSPISYISQTNTSTWVRVSVSFTSSATGVNYGIYLLDSASAGTMYFWGAQMEASSYVTSYIQSTSSSATRVADACFKTGISSLIGQTEGTMFVDFVFSRATDEYAYFSIQNASASSRVRVTYTRSSNTMQIDLVIAGAASIIYTFNPSDSQRYKIAVGYKSGDSVAYINGSQVGTQAATFTYTDLSSLNYDNPAASGTQPMTGKHNQTILFPTRLTNAQLASLTTI